MTVPTDRVSLTLLGPWLPAILADGSRRWVRPAEVAAEVDRNPVVDFAWGRADFDAATREFLIGLLATACGERMQDDAWAEWYERPPAPDVLDAAFAPLAEAFRLDGDGPRFGQDREELPDNAVPVGQLLIEAPGGNTVKKNLDHFVHRGGIECLSRPAAAMALFTLQTYAPAGGAGVRTSLRGGGPLTTLVRPARRPGRPEALWHTLWLNAVRPAAPTGRERSAAWIFPWLAATRVSDKGQTTTPEDVDPLQAYWGMPRRIRLDFVANPEGRPCDLTGLVDPIIVRTCRTRPHGTSYAAFRHPLTPHYQAKPGDPSSWLPVHGQPGRIAYRDWLGLAISDDPGNARREPAASVAQAPRRLDWLPDPIGPLRLTAAGYDFDNMKARDFTEGEMPLHLPPAPVRELHEAAVRQMVLGARDAAAVLASCVREADGPAEAARTEFWETTTAGFHDEARRLAHDLAEAADGGATASLDARLRWADALRAAAIAVFDRLAPLEELETLRPALARRRVGARRSLLFAMRGYGLGRSMFASLGLTPPDGAKKKVGRGKAKAEATS
ncbi:type I-E CRISPR-associated protein Cse1/CasA [Allostella sp. ATCC 35155]|nr:type I-E CRISPR-associated protein Cse1/CasA [Stella sp. ATCC 35155]